MLLVRSMRSEALRYGKVVGGWASAETALEQLTRVPREHRVWERCGTGG
ncbi:hypothetical protein [Streptomyces montanus]|nr:hypothetical protein [Streptomyces montanus]